MNRNSARAVFEQHNLCLRRIMWGWGAFVAGLVGMVTLGYIGNRNVWLVAACFVIAVIGFTLGAVGMLMISNLPQLPNDMGASAATEYFDHAVRHSARIIHQTRPGQFVLPDVFRSGANDAADRITYREWLAIAAAVRANDYRWTRDIVAQARVQPGNYKLTNLTAKFRLLNASLTAAGIVENNVVIADARGIFALPTPQGGTQ